MVFSSSSSSLRTVVLLAAKGLIVGALCLFVAASFLAFSVSGALGDPGDPVMVLLLFAVTGAVSLVLIAKYAADWRVWFLGLIVLALPLVSRMLLLGHV
jgi:hypothetical protein